jgi:hypothetical protein
VFSPFHRKSSMAQGELVRIVPVKRLVILRRLHFGRKVACCTQKAWLSASK